MKRSVLRPALVVSTAASALMALSAPVFADVPEGWSTPDEVPLLSYVIYLFLIPITTVVIAAALVYAIDVAKRGKDAGVHHPSDIEEMAAREAARPKAIAPHGH